MAWEGGWTPARTPLAYQAEMGVLWERLAQELALAKAPLQPRAETSRGPIEPRYQGFCPGPHTPPTLPSLICKRNGDPQRLAGPGCARLGPVDSDFHAVIFVGLGSLVGREA